MVDIPESLVVFADALGTSASTEDANEARRFLSALIGAEQRITARLKHAESRTGKVHYRWFSDSVLIMTELTDRKSLATVVEVAGQIYLEFLLKGVFLRGAMTRGPHFHGPNLDYGPALVRATNLEKAANVPCIMIDDDVWNVLGLMDSNVRDSILTDVEDERRFLNCFKFLAPEARRRARSEIESALAAATVEVRPKYEWLADHYDFAAGGSKRIGSGSLERFRPGA